MASIVGEMKEVPLFKLGELDAEAMRFLYELGTKNRSYTVQEIDGRMYVNTNDLVRIKEPFPAVLPTVNIFTLSGLVDYMVNVAVTVPAVSVDIPNHTHKVNIPAHSHSFTLQSHTHEIRYGIYEGEIASGVTIKVDGTAIPPEKVSGSEIDVIPYLSKDNNGRIVRGMWHEVSVVPDKLTRIQADLFVQTFVTSYTGGNY